MRYQLFKTMAQEQGLYLPDGSFRSKGEIDRKLAPPVTISPIPKVEPRTLQDWTDLLTLYQEKRREILPLPQRIAVTHKQGPVFYALLGDIHAGGDEVDYKRVNAEVDAIKHEPQAYVIAMGDLIDNFFFEPATQEDIVNRAEQGKYAEALLSELNGHLIAGVAGNHELWSEKSGATTYRDFTEKYKAHYLEGLSYIDLTVGDSPFKLAVAHQFGGHSIYNSAHPEMRMQREAGDGVDIFVGGHTHRKAINRQPIRGINGAREALYISLGAYKSTDGYSRKKGYPPLTYEEMGGVGLILYPEEKRVDAFWDIRSGLRAFQNLKTR